MVKSCKIHKQATTPNEVSATSPASLTTLLVVLYPSTSRGIVVVNQWMSAARRRLSFEAVALHATRFAPSTTTAPVLRMNIASETLLKVSQYSQVTQ